MPRLDDHLWRGPCAKGTKHRSHPRASARGLVAKAGEMINSSGSGPSLLAAHGAPGTDPTHGLQSTDVGGQGSSGHVNSWHHHLVQRSLVLFSVGVVLALVLNLLQVQRNVTLFPDEVIATIFSSAWWVPPCCGTAAVGPSRETPGAPCMPLKPGTWLTPPGLPPSQPPRAPVPLALAFSTLLRPGTLSLPSSKPSGNSEALESCVCEDSSRPHTVVGLLYPCIDSHLGEPHKFKREWASVMRCVAVFVGINHASAKLDFANNVQLSLTLAALSLGLWWTFDRSRSGLGLGITIAFLATLITQLLVYNGVYQYTSPDFLYIRSWLPCIFFSGGVTVGNIGRQLAMGVPEKPHSD
uniref:Insulin-induced gene protein n=1 Tax=Capra hircus TaxID=9925 RepID=A0A8C2PET3_CAPHI